MPKEKAPGLGPRLSMQGVLKGVHSFRCREGGRVTAGGRILARARCQSSPRVRAFGSRGTKGADEGASLPGANHRGRPRRAAWPVVRPRAEAAVPTWGRPGHFALPPGAWL